MKANVPELCLEKGGDIKSQLVETNLLVDLALVVHQSYAFGVGHKAPTSKGHILGQSGPLKCISHCLNEASDFNF